MKKEKKDNILFILKREEAPEYYAGPLISSSGDFFIEENEIKWTNDTKKASASKDFISMDRTFKFLWMLGIDVEKTYAGKA